MPDDNKSPLSNIEKIDLGEKLAERSEKPVDFGVEKSFEGEPDQAESLDEKRAAVSKEIASEEGGIIGASARSAKKREREKKIEDILGEGMDNLYLKMHPEKQQEFKSKGEETARNINIVLESGKGKVMKIIELIKNWLRIIPGVNKFFLEQEAKIKADEVMDLNDVFYNRIVSK